MSQALIDDQGRIDIVRKAEPTIFERGVFDATERQLLVRDTPLGRVGVLGGSDHLRADVCARMREGGEQIHVASWSGFSVFHGEWYKATFNPRWLSVAATRLRSALTSSLRWL